MLYFFCDNSSYSWDVKVPMLQKLMNMICQRQQFIGIRKDMQCVFFLFGEKHHMLTFIIIKKAKLLFLIENRKNF